MKRPKCFQSAVEYCDRKPRGNVRTWARGAKCSFHRCGNSAARCVKFRRESTKGSAAEVGEGAGCGVRGEVGKV